VIHTTRCAVPEELFARLAKVTI